MGERRTARPTPSRPATSVEERLANALVPQYSQTGVSNSTDAFAFGTIIVSGNARVDTLTVDTSATILSLAVTSGLTIGGSSVRSMAFRSATGADAIMVNSSWLSGPVSSSQLRSTAANIVAVGSSWQSGPVASTALNSTNAGIVAVGSSWQSGPVSSTALSSTAAGIVAVNSSWQSGPVSSTALRSTDAGIIAVDSSWRNGPVNTTALNLGGNVTSSSTGNMVGTSSTGIGGIYFGADNPNPLAAYSRQTWTPTVFGDGGNSTQTYTTREGEYLQIGGLILAWFNILLSDKDAGILGSVKITLPVAARATTAITTYGGTPFNVSSVTMTTGYSQYTYTIVQGATSAFLIQIGSGVASIGTPVGSMSTAARFRGMFVYEV